jgi:hypothetical protein
VEVETEAEIEKLHDFVKSESVASAERLQEMLEEMRALRAEVASLKTEPGR